MDTNETSSIKFGYYAHVHGQVFDAAIRFYTQDNGSGNTQERMSIVEDNVGIGTASPSSLLTLRESGVSTDLKFENSGTSRNWKLKMASSGVFSFLSSTAGHVINIEPALGNVGIATDDLATYRLNVNGEMYATKYHSPSPQIWPDYVFEDSYELTDIEEVEKYIEKNHHLPEIPSAAEVEANGIDIVDMQARLLQKIEELTLYVIEQNKKIETLSSQNERQQKELQQQSIQIQKLKKNKN